MNDVFAEQMRQEDAKDALLRKLAERFSDDAEIAALVRAAWGGAQ
ncbi:hypothetical protein [Acetobacter sp.]